MRSPVWPPWRKSSYLPGASPERTRVCSRPEGASPTVKPVRQGDPKSYRCPSTGELNVFLVLMAAQCCVSAPHACPNWSVAKRVGSNSDAVAYSHHFLCFFISPASVRPRTTAPAIPGSPVILFTAFCVCRTDTRSLVSATAVISYIV